MTLGDYQVDRTAFLQTESFAGGRKRVLESLFGQSEKQSIGIVAHSTQLAIDDRMLAAREAFEQACESDGFNPGSYETARWILCESHDGQKRPILINIDDTYVIYKPRSVDADLAWSGLIDWFSMIVGEQISQALCVVPRTRWGWMALIEHRPLDEGARVQKYYERLGLLGALVWVLGGTDATGSNVVAAGEFPTLIDAEMALVPGQELFDKSIEVEFRRGAIGPFMAQDKHGRYKSFGAAGLSGVCCVHGYEEMRCMNCHHVPFSGTNAFHVNGYEHALIKGFGAGLGLLRERKRELLNVSSPLSNFESSLGRVVLRPSAVYDLLKNQYFRSLRNAGRTPSLNQILRKIPLKQRVDAAAIDWLVEAESNAIACGDIPRFELRMSGHNLSDDGRSIAKLALSGMDRARGRISAQSESLCDHVSKQWEAYVRTATKSLSVTACEVIQK